MRRRGGRGQWHGTHNNGNHSANQRRGNRRNVLPHGQPTFSQECIGRARAGARMSSNTLAGVPASGDRRTRAGADECGCRAGREDAGSLTYADVFVGLFTSAAGMP